MASVLADMRAKVFHKRTLTIQFLGRVLGGIPARGDSLDYWIKAKHMSDAEEAGFRNRVKDGQLSEEEQANIQNTSRCVFERDKDGRLVMWHGNIKAMMKAGFVCEGLTQRKPKANKGEESAGGKNIVQHEINPLPLHIPFQRDGADIKAADGGVIAPKNGITEADGWQLKVKHIEDASGKRSALGEYEYLERPTLTFDIFWPRGWNPKGYGIFSEDDLKRVWAVCELDGLGAARSQSYGKFEVIAWKE